MKADFQRWSSLPLTIAGRIQSVKMNTLPKFLYLFQSLPLFLTKSFFRSVNQSITSFIWANKIPRVKKGLLHRGRDVGGLALPSFIHYYWATNFQKILFWLHLPDTDWCVFEAQSCHSSSLPALVYSSLPTNMSRFTSNPVVLSTLKIWAQFRNHYNFISPSPLGPICKNHLFPPSSLDLAFNRWSNKGLSCFKSLYGKDGFDSFGNIWKEYDLPYNNFFRYLQIRHCTKTLFSSFPALPTETEWEKMTLLPVQKGLISLLYPQLMSLEAQDLSKIKLRWENELMMELTDYQWKGALERVNSSSSCVRLGLIQFKVVHRAHLSKARLAEIYPGVDESCERCSYSPANLVHTFWACPQMNCYWKSVFKILSEVLKTEIQPCPLIAIFGVPNENLAVTRIQSDIIAFMSLLARRRILLHWKSPIPPTAAAWLKDVMSFLQLEKIKFTLRGSIQRFYSQWQPFLTYFENLEVLPDE